MVELLVSLVIMIFVAGVVGAAMYGVGRAVGYQAGLKQGRKNRHDEDWITRHGDDDWWRNVGK